MTTYADEVINRWADIYQACRLHQTGLNFEDFLASPVEHLSRLGMSDAEEIMQTGFLPLLPEQARIRQALSHPVSLLPESANEQCLSRTDATQPSWNIRTHGVLCLG